MLSLGGLTQIQGVSEKKLKGSNSDKYFRKISQK